ncbi:uncharacterized protein EKO05_0007172 [Ascochyta rabiei]|uniref:uncharacterized protein n=1 Tax=Didymella rabiei TaxID=5454 RepID=UPI0021FAE2FC|nr:uncharacterized protein EKO05_0007172 [Ascochyta rabiei]UPX16786.1 hypothetical protein EKO05_0007172 [Ascochyta rabiei]
MDPIDLSTLPPILRLPTELHLHIISFFSFEILRCYPANTANHCERKYYSYRKQLNQIDSSYYPNHVHNIHASYPVTVTDIAILDLRSTNTYFRTLIPLSHELLLDVDRSPQVPWTSIGRYRVCCVCLRLRPNYKFAYSHHLPPRLGLISSDQSRAFGARYRFCIDCGFSAYPHPHPGLPPRRQQRRLGIEPLGSTAYAPGTKVWFSPRPPFGRQGFEVWVWCMDCRLLKTSRESGETECILFCKECCQRLGCGDRCDELLSPGGGGRMRSGLRHIGYGGIMDEIEREKKRRESRLSAGAVYVARSSSLLLRRQERSACDEVEEEKEGERGDGDQEEAEWKGWFDLSNFPTLLARPAAPTKPKVVQFGTIEHQRLKNRHRRHFYD